NSGVVFAKPVESFIAISGVTDCLPLIMADNVLRVVPKPTATSSTVSFVPVSSAIPSIVSLINSPGCAGLNIAIIYVLMIIYIIYFLYIFSFNLKNDPVILVYLYRPKIFQVALQFM